MGGDNGGDRDGTSGAGGEGQRVMGVGARRDGQGSEGFRFRLRCGERLHGPGAAYGIGGTGEGY